MVAYKQMALCKLERRRVSMWVGVGVRALCVPRVCLCVCPCMQAHLYTGSHRTHQQTICTHTHTSIPLHKHKHNAHTCTYRHTCTHKHTPKAQKVQISPCSGQLLNDLPLQPPTSYFVPSHPLFLEDHMHKILQSTLVSIVGNVRSKRPKKM